MCIDSQLCGRADKVDIIIPVNAKQACQLVMGINYQKLSPATISLEIFKFTHSKLQLLKIVVKILKSSLIGGWYLSTQYTGTHNASFK